MHKNMSCKKNNEKYKSKYDVNQITRDGIDNYHLILQSEKWK